VTVDEAESKERFSNVNGGQGADFVTYVVNAPVRIDGGDGLDTLTIIGTALNDDSYRHTSPMKTFEYLAARRATVAANTPSMKSIMQEDTAFWYEPDNAHSLSHAIQEAYTSPETPAKIQAGYAFSAKHTWRERTERILAFITHGN